MDYMSRRKSQVDLVGNSVLESAYALSVKIDSTLCDRFSALSNTSGFGTDGAAVTDDVLIASVEKLDNADIQEENRRWIFEPSVKAELLKKDKLVRMDFFAGDTIPTGPFR